MQQVARIGFGTKGKSAGFDHNAWNGVQLRRRNPKRKARLPYHAKKQFSLPVMEAKGAMCAHALAQHEIIPWAYLGDNNRRRVQVKTLSYALPCISKHSSPKVAHRDSTGRKW